MTLLTGNPPRDGDRGCADLLIEVAFGEAQQATADFRSAPGPGFGQCGEFAWSSTTPIDALVVRGSLSDGSSTTNVARYSPPRSSGGGNAVPEPVDGTGIIAGIELCFTIPTPGDPNDGGSAGGGKAW